MSWAEELIYYTSSESLHCVELKYIRYASNLSFLQGLELLETSGTFTVFGLFLAL